MARPCPKSDICGDQVSKIVYLEQGWKESDSLWFYNISQGSDLVPYDFFLWLEQAKSTDLFRSPDNMNHVRYLPQKKTRSNPDALPVGMVENTYLGKKLMGFTCAACHCSQVNYHGTGIRIDGGPSAADMDTFMQAMDAAMEATLKDPAKEKRFVDAVRKEGHYSRESDITGDLHLYWLRLRAYNYFNQSRFKSSEGPAVYAAPKIYDAPLAYGFARLDAFGRIYNRVLGHLLDPTDIQETSLLEGAAGGPKRLQDVKANVQPFMKDRKADRDTLEARILDALPQEYQLALRDAESSTAPMRR